MIERVATDRASYRPGDDVELEVSLRSWQGAEAVETLRLRIPSGLDDGSLVLKVGGAESYHAWEADRLGEGLRPRSFEQHIKLIERSRPGNVVVAQVLAERPGLSLSGEEIRSLPGRAALAMASGATSGVVDPVQLSVVAEGELTLDRAVSGHHELRIAVRSEK